MDYFYNQLLLDQDVFFHVVFPTYGRLPLLKNDQVKGQVIELFEEIITDCGIDVTIYNLLSDHAHFLIHKHQHQSIPDIVKFLKGRSTFYFYEANPDFKIDLGRGRLWAKGYHSTIIKDVDQLERTIFYIHKNYDKYQD